MTGAERETLSVLLRLVETVDGKVDEVRNAVHGLDERVHKIEIASAQQMGVAAGTAAAVASNEARAEKRAVGIGRLFALVAAAATIAGAVAGVVARFI